MGSGGLMDEISTCRFVSAEILRECTGQHEMNIVVTGLIELGGSGVYYR